jgi:hypothetical protein
MGFNWVLKRLNRSIQNIQPYHHHHWYSAFGPVLAGTRAQSGDWYGSGTLHSRQVLRGSLPLFSPAFRHSHFCRQMPPRPPSTRALLAVKGGTVGENGLVILLKWRFLKPFRGPLHAVNLWHEANCFTSLPKEGMLRIFYSEKSSGFSWEQTCDLGYQRPAC